MKFKIIVITLLTAVLGNTAAKAQLLGNNERYSEYEYHVSIGAEGVYNVNPGQLYNPGFGGSIKFQYDVTQNLGVTIGAGYQLVTIKSKTNIGSPGDLTLVPVKLGAKAYFLPEFYFGGEVGVAYANPYIDYKSQSHFSKLLAPAVGYESNHLDVSVRYENVNHRNIYFSFITLRAAYIFNF